jgi:probable F420-dependent oxidoreductase
MRWQPSPSTDRTTSSLEQHMQFDSIVVDPQRTTGEQAAALERQGYGGVHTTELTHDPFVTATLIAAATERVQVGTEIAVAFARNPMSVAYSARDLQDLSGGRFTLGLGTQIAAHIVKRFSMPWGQPAARIREFVGAVRAVWASWDTGERLRFEGEFYAHTLMTPAFSPGPAPFGLPAIRLAAVGPKLAESAGAVADGLIPHVFCTRDYLTEVLLPSVERGRAEASTDRPFSVTAPVFVVSGGSAAARAAADADVRSRIAFYGSTPAYRPVLELHGWGDLGDRLHELSISRDPGKWAAMTRLIDDDVLSAFAIVEDDPADVLPAVIARFGGLVDRVTIEPPADVSAADWGALLQASAG